MITDTIASSIKGDSEILKETSEHYSDSVFESAAVVTSIFSCPPFSEEWTIGGRRVNGLLRIPEVTCNLLKLLYEKGTRLDLENAKDELWEVNREDLATLLATYLQNGDELRKLILEKMVTDIELEEVARCLGWLQSTDSPTVTIKPDYPTRKLLDAYNRDIANEDSLIILGGYDEQKHQFELRRVTQKDFLTFAKPRVVARIRDIRMIGPTSVEDAIRDELGHYLSEDQLDTLLKTSSLLEEVRTVYLGEIAKQGKEIDDITKTVGLYYFKSIIKGKREALPKQFVYFTLKGTPVAEHGLKDLANLAAGRTIARDIEYTEDKYEIDWNGIPMIFGILRLKDNVKPHGTD
ncbi:MAG: hypothetical protein UT34_C0002G0001 [candidate division WS6 bacterium GW2011_GWF2_39_15]|uniref:Uncharacterized protein n=1 Tax=candidate division WS6 bacterium GW2011_GWF2_39_15 TaxID=1619100 RepID=A0A0G0MN34_9BACT|nr:MAG: hypothetical protein UT34_C0002G0001 [candidate division WS6 bacterium GW2011_GWF2_39_15]